MDLIQEIETAAAALWSAGPNNPSMAESHAAHVFMRTPWWPRIKAALQPAGSTRRFGPLVAILRLMAQSVHYYVRRHELNDAADAIVSLVRELREERARHEATRRELAAARAAAEKWAGEFHALARSQQEEK